MRTYFKFWFSSQGWSTLEVAEKVKEIGLVTIKGPYDFYYDWGSIDPSDKDILQLGKKVQEALKEKEIIFKMDSKPIEYEKVVKW